jgi:hypothetical protein
MDRAFGVHRMDEGHVVHAGGEIREQVRDHLARLTIGPELPLGADDAADILMAATPERLDLDRLAVERVEIRLVVERVHMARAAIHEQEDHGLRLGRVMRRPGGEWIG